MFVNSVPKQLIYFAINFSEVGLVYVSVIS